MEQKTKHIICGGDFVGKSTLVKSVAEALGFDEIKTPTDLTRTGNLLRSPHWKAIYPESDPIVAANLYGIDINIFMNSNTSNHCVLDRWIITTAIIQAIRLCEKLSVNKKTALSDMFVGINSINGNFWTYVKNVLEFCPRSFPDTITILHADKNTIRERRESRKELSYSDKQIQWEKITQEAYLVFDKPEFKEMLGISKIPVNYIDTGKFNQKNTLEQTVDFISKNM